MHEPRIDVCNELVRKFCYFSVDTHTHIQIYRRRSWLIKSAAEIKEGSVSGLIIERNLRHCHSVARACNWFERRCVKSEARFSTLNDFLLVAAHLSSRLYSNAIFVSLFLFFRPKIREIFFLLLYSRVSFEK